MTSKTLVRLLAAATCGALTIGAARAATGSDYRHDAVVDETSEPWVPHVAETPEQPKPVAHTVAEAGTQMFVGGRFGGVENWPRTTRYVRVNVFAFDATTGAVNQDVAPAVDGIVWSAVSDGASVWIGGSFRTAGGQARSTLAKLDLADLDPARPTWINYTGGDLLKSVAVTGAAVYVQGHSRWLDNPFGQDTKGPGAVDRLGGGAVDPETGLALPWNPVMPQSSGGYRITPTADGVWFATDGTRFGGRYPRGIRFASLP